MKILITGGCGFLGANIAAELIRRGDSVTVFDNLSRKGSAQNREWLKTAGAFEFIEADVRHFESVASVVRTQRPEVVLHLAGQVAMTTSIENPRLDFEINAMGTLNVLEAVRKHAPDALVTYSSTNKVYGDLEEYPYREGETRYHLDQFPQGFDEHLTLAFCSPYGCSKGSADQYMLDYARVFGLKTIVFRHSSIFGGRQFSTADQGWIGWFVEKALEVQEGKSSGPVSISGNGKQVRDVLFSSDLVALYLNAIRFADRARGQAFNIGGGMANSLSLRELFAFLESELSICIPIRELPWRQSDQKIFVANIARAQQTFAWAPQVDCGEGLRRMIQWVKESRQTTVVQPG